MERAEAVPLSREHILEMRDRMAAAIAEEQGVVGGVKPEQRRAADVALKAILPDLRRLTK
jgi:DNA-binding transcriptional regulator YbjK